MESIKELEDRLSTPSRQLVQDIKAVKGDILILGAGGKMGPSLARLAVRAVQEAGSGQKVIAVSRFSETGLREELEKAGVETISADLLNEQELQSLPGAPNVIYMAGKKFGTKGHEHLTWAMNAWLPGQVAEKFKKSRIVVFSSGNVYPFVPYGSGGATEQTSPGPVGEYAQSCLGRERIFEHFSHRYRTPMLIYRLNYAVEMRYGALLEIARAVFEKKPVDLRSGHLNVIWQGDANEIAIRSILHCSSPPHLLNVTGPETISVRQAAGELGRLLGKTPRFIHEEEPTALLNNASRAHRLFGYPKVSLDQVIAWTAAWVMQGGETIDKPTHFQEREGKF